MDLITGNTDPVGVVMDMLKDGPVPEEELRVRALEIVLYVATEMIQGFRESVNAIEEDVDEGIESLESAILAEWEDIRVIREGRG